MSNARTLAGLIDTNNKIQVPSGGIQFADATNANTVANESNLIKQDGYEEGTFAITVSGSTSGSTTYTISTGVQGRYTKFGNLVYCEINIDNQTFPTFSGVLRIYLPFTMSGVGFEAKSGDVYWYPSSAWDSTTNHTGFTASVFSGNSYNVLSIKAVDSNRQNSVTSSNTPNLVGASGAYLRYNICYTTS